jgi:hypothetical protein
MAYSAYVTQLKNVQKDPNSDRLYTAECLTEQVIVGSTSYEDQLVLYFPAGGQIDYDFAMAFGLLRKDKDGNPAGGYLDANRHIRALRLRGLRSEGIAIAVSTVATQYPAITLCPIGLPVTTLGDTEICRKYIPRQRRAGGSPKTSTRGKKAATVVYPEFDMHIDTGQLAYNQEAFREGDIYCISLKIHGTSQRSMLTYGEYPLNWFQRLLRRIGLKVRPRIKEAYVLGTRRTIVTKEEGGYYGNDKFRFAHHEKMQPHVLPGMEIFYEVAGYVQDEQTIMPMCENKKLNDKEFTKKFGSRTIFTYGCAPGESRAFVYRIRLGDTELEPHAIKEWCDKAGVDMAPILNAPTYAFTSWEMLMDNVNQAVGDLTDPIDGTHLMEGVVVRILNRRSFVAFKHKTYEFKVLEGIIKETADAPDMEEADGLAEEV